MSEPHTAYRVTPDPEPGVDTALAPWIQYQAQRCRELGFEMEVEAGHLCLSGLADNTDGLIEIEKAATSLAARARAIARRCRAGKVTR